MRYKSVIGKCKVEFLNGEARQSAIDNIIMARHEETKNFDYDRSVAARTAVARLTVLKMTAKVNPIRGGVDT